jgi:hypothetical protein
VTSISSGQVSLHWNAPVSGPAPTSYAVERSTNFQTGSFMTAGTVAGSPPPVMFQDNSVTGSPAGNTSTSPICYLYRVRSAIGSVTSNPTNLVFATTKDFFDGPNVVGVPSGTPVKAVHVLELRNAVGAVYATAFGVSGISTWDSGSVQTRGLVYAANVAEMRATNSAGNLQAALNHMGFPLPTYSTSPSQHGQMHKEDINETRAAARIGVRSN